MTRVENRNDKNSKNTDACVVADKQELLGSCFFMFYLPEIHIQGCQASQHVFQKVLFEAVTKCVSESCVCKLSQYFIQSYV